MILKSNFGRGFLELAYLFILLLLISNGRSLLIKTKLGEIRGIDKLTTRTTRYTAYLGIPYAIPPIDALRFKDPQPSKEWTGVFNATQMPDYCIQKSAVQQRYGSDPFVGSEDCLYLNVFAPKNKDDLSVMVYLHGGAFYRGGAKEYIPTGFLDENVIMVIPQYRLGVFGFLSTEDSTLPGNLGLKDQNLALKWVRDNIESFGGNPRNVTLFGQSAGAAAVHYHSMSPWSKGLFNRAILQSGSALCPWAQNNNHRQFASKLGEKFGCPIDSITYLTCLQQIDAFDMLKYASNFTKFYISPNYFTPRVDGDFISESVEKAVQHVLPEIDIIAGVVRDEGGAALGSLEDLENDDNLRPISLVVEDEENPETFTSKIFDKYFGKKEDIRKNKEAFVQMIGDRYFHICHQMFVNFYSERNNSKLYLYEFNYRPVWSRVSPDQTLLKNLIIHGDELSYLFSGQGMVYDNLFTKEDRAMKLILKKLWTNFAIYGNPTPDDILGFVWKNSSAKMEHLNINTNPKMEENNRKMSTLFWKSLPLKQNDLIFKNNLFHQKYGLKYLPEIFEEKFVPETVEFVQNNEL